MQWAEIFCQAKYSDTFKPDGGIHSDITEYMWYNDLG